MAKLDDLAERVDQLVLRHQELKRTTALIAEQLVAVTTERDSLKSRLSAARLRIDSLLERLQGGTVAQPEVQVQAPISEAAPALNAAAQIQSPSSKPDRGATTEASA
jgi:cell division protein ZapB